MAYDKILTAEHGGGALRIGERAGLVSRVMPTGVRVERRLFHSLFGTADQQEGMVAFLAKRKPRFVHR